MANVDIIKVMEVGEIKELTRPEIKPLPNIGKKRIQPQVPSVETMAMCSHAEVIIPEIPIYQFSCEQCGKGFTHKNNLLMHKNNHK